MQRFHSERTGTERQVGEVYSLHRVTRTIVRSKAITNRKERTFGAGTPPLEGSELGQALSLLVLGLCGYLFYGMT